MPPVSAPKHNSAYLSHGLAMLTVVWVIAILSLISLAMMKAYLSNTEATQYEIESIKADFLMDAGLKFAALSIASPRANVVASAVPQPELKYSTGIGEVTIQISNEAGRIDLNSADPRLLENLFKANNLTIQKSLLNSLSANSYRAIYEKHSDTPKLLNLIARYATIHNGQTGVHPLLASEAVLEVVPDISNAQRQRLVRERSLKQKSIISSPTRSEYLIDQVSAHYRISTQVSFGQQSYNRTQIIKMVNQGARLYEVVATL